MKTKNILHGLSMSVVLHFGVLASSAQTNYYLFSGSETNITLNPGTYIITAYGAMGGFADNEVTGILGGLGAEMSAEFNFSASTILTLLVGTDAAVADGTDNGGVPAVMLTENGGPFRVTAEGPLSVDVARIYAGSCKFTHTVGTYSCSSTTLPSGAYVIQFGTFLECGFGPYHY